MVPLARIAACALAKVANGAASVPAVVVAAVGRNVECVRIDRGSSIYVCFERPQRHFLSRRHASGLDRYEIGITGRSSHTQLINSETLRKARLSRLDRQKSIKYNRVFDFYHVIFSYCTKVEVPVSANKGTPSAAKRVFGGGGAGGGLAVLTWTGIETATVTPFCVAVTPH
jgi:hypothetical protein